ncbi:MAG: hypothetical protein ACWA41_12805 [Putridiphycobacter sp.]
MLKNKIIKSIVTTLFLLSIFIGLTGGVISFFSDTITTEIELPFGTPAGIAVTENNIFLNLSDYSRIQKYDKQGNFVKSWITDNTKGATYLRLNEKNNLELFVVRNRLLLEYDENGEILSSKSNFFEENFVKNEKSFLDKKFHVRYWVEGTFFPKLISNDNGEYRVLKRSGFLLFVFAFPFPSVIFIFSGLLFFFFRSYKKQNL